MLSAFIGLPAAVSGQSVREVMMDKEGKYLYSQCRDSDIGVAYETAHAGLLQKVKSWCGANGVASPDDLADVQAHIHRINGEVMGQHRVFLFVSTEALRSGDTPTPAHEELVPKEASPAKVTAENIGKQEEQAPRSSYASTSESISVGNTSAPVPVATPAGILTGRLGDIVASLLRCSSEKEILDRLAREKRARGISLYGRGASRYTPYACLVKTEGGRVTVLSPELPDGNRTDYSSGITTASPGNAEGWIWFLAK